MSKDITIENTSQSIFKKVKREDKYAQISNDLINNRNLSYKALGIITYILSKPNDWCVYISDLVRDEKDGEKSVRSGIKELIENKYMQRYRVYDKDTKKVNHWETLVSEIPFNDDEIITSVKEKYLRNDNGEIINQKIKFGNFERLTPIVIEREVELLSQKGKIDKKELLSQNVKVEKLQVEKEGQQILDNTKTDFNKNLNCSSSITLSNVSLTDIKDIINYFEDNICELKKTTKIKFLNYCSLYNKDMVLAIIDECTSTHVTSYKGFEVAFDSYVERDCKTKEDVIKAAMIYRSKKLAPKYNSKNGSARKFNNFEPRQYDYESLEKRLLGWDKED